MKKTILILTVLFSINNSFAQSLFSNTFPLNGNVGVGILTPTSKLHVNSTTSSVAIRVSANQPGNTNNSFMDMAIPRNNNNYSSLANAYDVVLRAAPGAGKFLVTNTGIGSTVFATGGFGNETERMVITVDGNIGIGKSNPTDKLEVNGRIHARSVKVDLDDWPDYVFLSNYSLTPLKKVEQFIENNGHLENVPSAQEIMNKGLDLGAMDKVLLEKIEELTLHLIQKEKEIEAIKTEKDDLAQKLKKLVEKVDLIELKLK